MQTSPRAHGLAQYPEPPRSATPRLSSEHTSEPHSADLDDTYAHTVASSSRHRHRHSGSREARLKRRLWVARGVALATTVGGVALAILAIHYHARVDSLEAENNELASQLSHSQQEAKEAKQLIAAQEVELATQMRQRIPGVTPMELGRFYDVDNAYFRKISFSESGVGEARRLTYFAVLKNAGDSSVVPSARILLFDRQGLQTGVAELAKKAATPPSDRDDLAPGEARNYSAPIESLRPEEPRYFLVQLD